MPDTLGQDIILNAEQPFQSCEDPDPSSNQSPEHGVRDLAMVAE